MKSAPGSASGPAFRWKVRVYYEDTDAGGVVYYVNFLKFFERCRTEWLRAIGVEQDLLARTEGVQFVVARMEIDYRRPARLDDELTIEAVAPEPRRLASVVFDQRAWRGDELLASGSVRIACVDCRTFAPVRIPASVLEGLGG